MLYEATRVGTLHWQQALSIHEGRQGRLSEHLILMFVRVLHPVQNPVQTLFIPEASRSHAINSSHITAYDYGSLTA